MTENTAFYRVLADAVLIVHFGFVAFVVVGLAVIWLGGALKWPWVRNFWFRMAHLAAIGIVVAESVAGVICPLTTWEDHLRRLAGGGENYAGSFIQHWVHKVMFFEASESTFTTIYIVFFSAVLGSFWAVRPRWPARKLTATATAESPSRAAP